MRLPAVRSSQLRTALCSLGWTVFVLGMAWCFCAPRLEAADDERPVLLEAVFESGNEAGLPPGWQVPQSIRNAGGNAVVMRDLQDSYLRVLTGPGTPEGSRVDPAPVFRWARGSVFTTLSCEAWRGRLLRVLIEARSQSGPNASRREAGRFWIRLDDARSGRIPLFYDDTRRELDSPNWETYAIDFPVLSEAETLRMGIDLRQGAIDVRRIRLVDLGPSGVTEARPLSPAEIQNLEVFARVFGFVRFFHPSDEGASVDWNEFLVDGIPRVLSAETGDSLATVLREIFSPVAPTVEIDGMTARADAWRGVEFLPGTQIPRDAIEVVRWHHYGPGFQDGNLPYRSYRERAPVDSTGAIRRDRRNWEDVWDASKTGSTASNPPNGSEVGIVDEDRRYVVELDGMEIAVPLELYSDVSATLPHSDPLEHGIGQAGALSKPPGFRMVSEDRTTRLAAVILLWNVAQHFYPYFDEIDGDWMSELAPALRAAATSRGQAEFIATIERMLVPLEDGHGGVYPYYSRNSGRLPLELVWVGNEIAVSWIDREDGWQRSQGPRPGDLVLGMDLEESGRIIDLSTLADSLSEQISSPTQEWRRQQILERMLHGRIGQSRTLRLQSTNGDSFEKAFVLGPNREIESRRHLRGPAAIAQLGDGLLYVDTRRADEGLLRRYWNALSRARGILVDFRGYPESLSQQFLGHWMEEPATSPTWFVAVDRAPDRVLRRYQSRVWTVNPSLPKIEAPTVFLTDAQAISKAETFLTIIDEHEVGRIVGSPTAGTTGNRFTLALPGGLRVTMTGMKVRKQDGSPFHGVGVAPDVVILPTLEGIRAERDEVFERGLRELQSLVDTTKP